jgi:predicted esterase
MLFVTRHRPSAFALVLLLAVAMPLHAQGLKTWPSPANAAPAAASIPPALPTVPGHHKLQFQAPGAAATSGHPAPASDPAPIKLGVELYLPAGYDKTCAPCPMIVFLHGAGEIGDNLDYAIMVHGPSAELVRHPKLAERFPFIVLSPQCPEGKRWESPGMVEALAALIREVESRYRVDRSRVYLTGLSLGGQGTWLLALHAPDLFAAIVPISARAVEPAVAAQRLKGIAIWIIVGTDDNEFTDGSRLMTNALIQAGLDATLTEVPRMGHAVHDHYYPQPAFYDWLLANRRGQPPAPGRLGPDQLVAMGLTDTPDMQAITRLSDQFHKFLPYWQLLNCGGDHQPGLRPQYDGHSNVFVTTPLTPEIPALLQTTWKLDAGRKAALHIVAGRDLAGCWQLIVHANGREIYSQPVSANTAPTGWEELRIDLSPYAGQAVRLEVLDGATGETNPTAYWNRVEIEYH